MAGSAEEFGERARNIHALAKLQADALVGKINALTSDLLMFAGAPASVQGSWLDTVKAAVDDQARATARTLAAYRYLHGQEA